MRAALGRRRMLGLLASGAAVAGLGSVGSARAGAKTLAGSAENGVAMPPARPDEAMPEELFVQARLRNYKSRRSSSWDRSGGNNDAVPVEAGKAATVLEVSGAGVVTHLWFTINSSDRYHLKNLVLRAWWDGEATPSIEVPIGDFFGLGLGEYFVYQSSMTAVASVKALNSYFQMPFASGAKLTVTNEGRIKTDSLYFAVDYILLPSLPADLGRFHAQYRQGNPVKSEINDWTDEYAERPNEIKNLDGKGNYTFMEATGRGHFVGLTQAVLQNQDGWFGEGDDMFFIDGDTQPTINGTGTEDYFNGAWGYSGEAFAFQHNGTPFLVNADRIGGRLCQYRWHTESPIAFEKSIRVTMEHGQANHRADDFFTVAYWFQTEPHAPFPALPEPAARVPRVFQVGGAGARSAPGE